MRYRKNKIILFFALPITIIFMLSGCSYSFTGSSVPAHLHTIAIPIFKDRSGSGEPNLASLFTNQLIQKFIDDNTLQIANKMNADAVAQGTILSLSDMPAIVSKGENVSSRRIKITVRVLYRDLVKRKTVFDRNFSNYADYNNNGIIVDAREKAIKSAINKITDDILLAIVSNW